MSNFGWGCLVVIAFFCLVGYVAWLTDSPNALWALLLTPNISTGKK